MTTMIPKKCFLFANFVVKSLQCHVNVPENTSSKLNFALKRCSTFLIKSYCVAINQLGYGEESGQLVILHNSIDLKS